jgi:hypothetical protein
MLYLSEKMSDCQRSICTYDYQLWCCYRAPYTTIFLTRIKMTRQILPGRFCRVIFAYRQFLPSCDALRFFTNALHRIFFWPRGGGRGDRPRGGRRSH